MIRDIDPLLTKESTIQAFKALPTVNVVLNAVKDVADGTTVEEMGKTFHKHDLILLYFVNGFRRIYFICSVNNMLNF
jgi:hypothetical protein